MRAETNLMTVPGTHNNEMGKWLLTLAAADAELGPLLSPAAKDREAAGYGHTLVEICQQPLLWADTARRVTGMKERLAELLKGAQWLVIAGSGSSQYAGECVHPALQAEMGIPVFSAGGGWLLLEGLRGIPPSRPGLLVSLARSGDSPESVGVVELYLETAPSVRHLVITCNDGGRLVTRYRASARAPGRGRAELTNDRGPAPPAVALYPSDRRRGAGTFPPGRFSGERLSLRRGAGIRSEDAGNERRRHTDTGRDLPGTAAWANVPGGSGDAGSVFPLIGSAGARLDRKAAGW